MKEKDRKWQKHFRAEQSPCPSSWSTSMQINVLQHLDLSWCLQKTQSSRSQNQLIFIQLQQGIQTNNCFSEIFWEHIVFSLFMFCHSTHQTIPGWQWKYFGFGRKSQIFSKRFICSIEKQTVESGYERIYKGKSNTVKTHVTRHCSFVKGLKLKTMHCILYILPIFSMLLSFISSLFPLCISTAARQFPLGINQVLSYLKILIWKATRKCSCQINVDQ